MKNNQINKLFFFLNLLFILANAPPLYAQETTPDRQENVKAEVAEVVKQETKIIPGTDTTSLYQTLKVKILDGENKGEEVTIQNDYLELKRGDVFYALHTVSALDNTDVYIVSEPYRLPWVLFFVALFIFVVFIFGGKQGARGLGALALSFFFILYLLLPGILHGYSPILVSMGVAALIIVLGSYITHGFNKTTSAAVLGMIVTIIVTGILAYIAVHVTRLSGFSDEETIYLNFATRGGIDFAGLLLGGILIGLLGILYDAAIGQSVSVEELFDTGPHLSRRAIYKKAIRIGREHIGALVNTLAIAYVGAALPLLLLLSTSEQTLAVTLNREIFATEIIRMSVGSIGLILAVPITTLISIFMIVKKDHSK